LDGVVYVRNRRTYTYCEISNALGGAVCVLEWSRVDEDVASNKNARRLRGKGLK